MSRVWTFGAVGDVFVNRPDPEAAFNYCAPALQSLDLAFGNCEGAFTDTTHRAPSAGWRVVAGLSNAVSLGAAGFHVMSCANNHALDAGHEGLADSLAELRRQGIATCGAGADWRAAHEPAILERNGIKIAVLAYASVHQAGYEARDQVPGLASMRIHSHYYIPGWDAYGKVEPGHPPQVRTVPYPEDVEKLQKAIALAKEKCDVVVASFHWGRASQPAILTDYEAILGRAAIDFGADVVLGHHHHYLRGVELYRGKPIFYGLGHFVFDLPGLGKALNEVELAKLRAMGEHAIYPREGYPLAPFHPDARMTMIAVCRFADRTLSGAGFVPCLINSDNHAVPVAVASDAGQQILRYMREISESARLPTTYSADGPALGRFGTIEVS